ncbi:MAG: hypothetical protein AAFQ67_04725, partial [Pseudomonadota bacterium]
MSSKRTAVVFVHGQGEQRPMESVRDLATVAWQTDQNIRIDKRDGLVDRRLWSIPDEEGETYDLRRLSTETDNDGRRFDFFEFYWADLFRDTARRHIWSWFNGLMARPTTEVPNNILRIRQMGIRATEVLLIFAIITLALTTFRLSDPITDWSVDKLRFQEFVRIYFQALVWAAPWIACMAGATLTALIIAIDWNATGRRRAEAYPYANADVLGDGTSQRSDAEREHLRRKIERREARQDRLARFVPGAFGVTGALALCGLQGVLLGLVPLDDQATFKDMFRDAMAALMV